MGQGAGTEAKPITTAVVNSVTERRSQIPSSGEALEAGAQRNAPKPTQGENYDEAKKIADLPANKQKLTRLEEGKSLEIVRTTNKSRVAYTFEKHNGKIYVKLGDELINLDNKEDKRPVSQAGTKGQTAPAAPPKPETPKIEYGKNINAVLQVELDRKEIQQKLAELQKRNKIDVDSWTIFKDENGDYFFQSLDTKEKNLWTAVKNAENQFVISQDNNLTATAIKEIAGKIYYRPKEMGGSIWFEAKDVSTISTSNGPNQTVTGYLETKDSEGKPTTKAVTVAMHENKPVYKTSPEAELFISSDGNLLEVKENKFEKLTKVDLDKAYESFNKQLQSKLAELGKNHLRNSTLITAFNTYTKTDGRPQLFLRNANNVVSIYEADGSKVVDFQVVQDKNNHKLQYLDGDKIKTADSLGVILGEKPPYKFQLLVEEGKVKFSIASDTKSLLEANREDNKRGRSGLVAAITKTTGAVTGRILDGDLPGAGRAIITAATGAAQKQARQVIIGKLDPKKEVVSAPVPLQ